MKHQKQQAELRKSNATGNLCSGLTAPCQAIEEAGVTDRAALWTGITAHLNSPLTAMPALV